MFTRDNNIVPNYDVQSQLPGLQNITISEAGILSLLLNYDVKKSSGPDDIPNLFLKRYAEWVSNYLFVIFKTSLATSRLPADWKLAIVKPIYKSGDPRIAVNYRPISLTCISCKLLEHIIAKHIVAYVTEHNLLSNVQHGFRAGYSTISQLVGTVHNFSSVINRRGQVDVIYLDFSKAFDKVSHPKILLKLRAMLKNDQIVNWIQDFLSGRGQYVMFNQTASSIANIESGVPQGSVLGPLLF